LVLRPLGSLRNIMCNRESHCPIWPIGAIVVKLGSHLRGGASMCASLFRESGRMLPQTLSLTTLVCMEMLKALSAVSVNDSLFRVGPQKNKWLLLGVSGPFLLHLFVLYSSKFGIGGLGESFGMVC
jgi:hypothetical protein